jgi:hypothetical protein
MPTGVIRLDDGWTFNSGQRMDEPPMVTLPVPPSVHRTKGNKIMSQDYVSPKRDSRYVWYGKLSDNVVAEAVKFGAAAGDATAFKAIVDGIIAKMKATNTAQDAVDSARSLEVAAEKAGLAQLRAKVRNWKTLPGWAASGSEAVLELSGSSTTFDPASYQTKLTASLVPGGVRLAFVKQGAEGAAFYSRIAGTATWKKIGTCNHSPFIDHTPLAQAGVAESREYMARGLMNDAELPLDSDPVIILFPG